MSDFLKKLEGFSPDKVKLTKEALLSSPEFKQKFKGQLDNLSAADKARAKGILFSDQAEDIRENPNVPTGQIKAKADRQLEQEQNPSSTKVLIQPSSTEEQQAVDEETGDLGSSIPLISAGAEEMPEIQQGRLQREEERVAKVKQQTGEKMALERDAREKTQESLDTGLAIMTGAMEAIPFGKQVSANLNAAADSLITGKDYKQAKAENLSLISQAQLKADQDHPWVKGTTELGFNIAATLVPGSVAVKAANWSVKAANITKALNSAKAVKDLPTVAKLTRDLAAVNKSIFWTHAGIDTGYQAMLGFSKSEEQDFNSLMTNAGTAALFTGLGAGIFKGVSKIYGYVKNNKVATHITNSVSRGSKEMMDSVKKFVVSESKYTDGARMKDVIRVLEEDEVYQGLIKNGKTVQASNRLKLLAKESRQELEEFYSKVDGVVIPKMTQSETKLLENKLNGVINKASNRLHGLAGKKKDLNELDSIKERITRALQREAFDPATGEIIVPKALGRPFMVSKEPSYTDLVDVLENLKDIRNTKIDTFDGENVIRILEEARDSFKNKIPGNTEAGRAARDSVGELEKKHRILNHLSTESDQIISEITDMSEVGIFKRAANNAAIHIQRAENAYGKTGLLVSGAKYSAAFLSGLMSDPVVINQLKNKNILGLTTPEQVVNKMADTFSYFATGSGADSKYAATLGHRLINAFRNKDDETINENIAGYSALKNLLNNPVDRTSESFFRNKDDILRLVSLEDRELASNLTSAMHKGEDIAPFLSLVANASWAKEWFKDGKGIDGRVFTEEEKDALVQEVKMNPLLPSSRKLEINREIMQNGTIPDLDGEMAGARSPRVPVKHKNKRRY